MPELRPSASPSRIGNLYRATLLRAGHYFYNRNRHELAVRFFTAAAAQDPSREAAPAHLRMSRHKVALKTPPKHGLNHLRFVGLGTTGLCNASCVHCPTGKLETDHVPRTPMPMPLFRSIIDQFHDLGLTLTSHLAFGLFGDGFVDPFVVERTKYASEKLPHVEVVINTNGAAFDPKRHRAVRAYHPVISLHCESLRPERYDYLMQPLRLDRVRTKMEMLLETFPNWVNVSVPVSRLNLDELEEVREWFMARGARTVVFDPMSSRCADDRTVFDQLALAPHPIKCGPDIMDDMIIDCDGKVLLCCQDFQRLEGMGNLTLDSVQDVLTSMRRESVKKTLTDGRHEDLTTCNKCYGDLRTPDFPFDIRFDAHAAS